MGKTFSLLLRMSQLTKVETGHHSLNLILGSSSFVLQLLCFESLLAQGKAKGLGDQGIKFFSKIQSAQNRFKPDESVGLIVANPTQLISSQTDVRSERYCNLFGMSNRQKRGR
jgi:hypothetical protein